MTLPDEDGADGGVGGWTRAGGGGWGTGRPPTIPPPSNMAPTPLSPLPKRTLVAIFMLFRFLRRDDWNASGPSWLPGGGPTGVTGWPPEDPITGTTRVRSSSGSGGWIPTNVGRSWGGGWSGAEGGRPPATPPSFSSRGSSFDNLHQAETQCQMLFLLLNFLPWHLSFFFYFSMSWLMWYFFACLSSVDNIVWKLYTLIIDTS